MIPLFHSLCCPSTSAWSRSTAILLASITKHVINVRICAVKPGEVDLPFLFVREFDLVYTTVYMLLHSHAVFLRFTFFE